MDFTHDLAEGLEVSANKPPERPRLHWKAAIAHVHFASAGACAVARVVIAVLPCRLRDADDAIPAPHSAK